MNILYAFLLLLLIHQISDNEDKIKYQNAYNYIINSDDTKKFINRFSKSSYNITVFDSTTYISFGIFYKDCQKILYNYEYVKGSLMEDRKINYSKFLKFDKDHKNDFELKLIDYLPDNINMKNQDTNFYEFIIFFDDIYHDFLLVELYPVTEKKQLYKKNYFRNIRIFTTSIVFLFHFRDNQIIYTNNTVLID